MSNNRKKGSLLEDLRGDEAENKVKSLTYQSLGLEARNVFHQRNPHADLGKCTTDELVLQIQETLREIRNETFDKFQFF